ncbi:hypothetical protein TRICI_003865 [Trichomonascus ciferrii]|uniref:Non-canonical purine NTP pyrophosphatase n=1 Tax=Trichomonascus ciferrii TaxID=44093 RepID=A0A642V2S1_9ASCO|nr:hypothetical protein TRICI_003865 [Trichomonascus ciferrii]
MSSEKIVFVTGNKNKLAEVNAILGADKLDNVSLDLEEVQGTVEEVSTHKAKSAAEKVGVVSTLLWNLAPLVDFRDHTCKRTSVNNAKSKTNPMVLLANGSKKALETRAWWICCTSSKTSLPAPSVPLPTVAARDMKFNCSKALPQGKSSPHEERKYLVGIQSSNLKATTKRKFPPTFFIIHLTVTSSYAELDNDVKNSISHRSKALEKLKEFLKDRA